MAKAEPPPPNQSGDLLFAWLSPIEAKVDKRLHPKSQGVHLPASSPLVTRAKSALRKTVRASHVNSFKTSEQKAKVKEANDACLWLRAAGFPQYVQMFEEGLFPINLSKFEVEQDHTFLEQADLDSLIRRLNILNRCADVMDSVRSKGYDSDDETNFRALSDRWQFRRKQKKWLRRKEKKDSATPQESLFSSTEDLLDDTPSEAKGTPTDPSPLMLVSELRKSLTGLDRAVKTYSFMVSDDQVPVIQVESPPISRDSPPASRASVQRVPLHNTSSQFSSLDSEEDLTGWEFDPYPSGGMDNFATGILDTFESNLLKLKDFQTQSLPDVFEATKHFGHHDDGSSDISPLSSASVSTASILDAADLVDPSRDSPSSGAHAVYPSGMSPLALNGCSSPSPGEKDRYGIDISFISSVEMKSPPEGRRGQRTKRVSSAGSCRTWESSSPAGSELSEREHGAPSPQPLAAKVVNGMGNGIMANGFDSTPPPQHQRHSSLDDSATRTSRISVTSSKFDEPIRRFESKWHSYQRPHNFRTAFKPVRTLIPIEELSVGQIGVLRKLSLVKLTAQLELYSYKSKSNIARMLKGKKLKRIDSKHKTVFGAPLASNVRQYGHALPPVILNALKYLREDDRLQLLGLFRRAASKARVDLLREMAEADPELSDFEEFSAYEVADFIKLYCRELPEPVFTSKMSEILLLVQENVPSQVRLPALQAVMLLLPDEHREVLQILLFFLKDVASYSDINQMTPQNLGVCFSPTLFFLPGPMLRATNSLVRKGSFKRNTLTPGLSPTQLASSKDVNDSVVSSHCLSQMILQVDKLFQVATDMLQVCRFTHLEAGDPVPYYELGLDRKGSGNVHSYLDTSIQTVLREARKKFKGWGHCESVDGVEISYIRPRDGVSLWVWRGACDINVGSGFLQRRLWMDRYIWDTEMTSPKLVTTVDSQTEVFQYTTPSSSPFAERDHCVLRSWQYDPSSQNYVFVSTSVSHPSASLQGGIRAMQLATFYLIEPLDTDKSRLSFICRVDMRGRSAEYYNKAYGPYLASTVSRMRDACGDQTILETSV